MATAKRRASVLDLREHGGTLEPAGKTNRHPILMVATLATLSFVSLTLI
jgi:hypothetical protein